MLRTALFFNFFVTYYYLKARSQVADQVINGHSDFILQFVFAAKQQKLTTWEAFFFDAYQADHRHLLYQIT